MPDIKLRDYQQNCIDASIEAMDRGIRRQLISSATGSGKTLVASFLVPLLAQKVAEQYPNRRQIVLAAHREELCDQLATTMKRINPSLTVEIEKAEKSADPNVDVIVASIPTIGRANSKRIQKFNPAKLAVMVVDESHHCSGSTYLNVLEYFGVDKPDCQAVSLGFTATPKRHDKVGLRHAYDEIVYHKSLMALMDEGYLCAMRCFKVNTTVDISDVKSNRGDFAIGALSEAVNIKERNDLIVEAWNKYAYGRKSTLVFATDVKHSFALRDLFREADISAETVVGTTDPIERQDIFQRFKNRKFKILVNCTVVSEGADIPNIDCVLLARPTKSPLLLTQMCGRGMRLFLEKKDCLFLDVVDTLRRGSLMTVPSLVGLNPDFDFEGGDVSTAIRAIEKAAESSVRALSATSVANAQNIASKVFNPFEMKPDPSVSKYSQYTWASLEEDHWAIDLKDQGHFEIFQDMLGEWNIHWHKPNGRLYNIGKNYSLSKIFQIADAEIQDKAPRNTQVLIDSTAPWRDLPATEKQLEKLKKWRVPIKSNLTRGEASMLMDAKLKEFEKYRYLKERKENGKKVKSEYLEVKIGAVS